MCIAQARAFAIEAHNDQKYGDNDYVKHLDDVYEIASKLKEPDLEILIACYLHDVLEDTDCSYRTLEMNFGKEISDIVYAVTDELGEDRADRKQKTYPKIVKCNKAITLKACDRLANIKACLGGSLYEWNSILKYKFKMYFVEHNDFCNKLNLSNNSNLKEHRKLYQELESLFRFRVLDMKTIKINKEGGNTNEKD